MTTTQTTLATADDPGATPAAGAAAAPGVVLVRDRAVRAIALGERDFVFGRGDDVDLQLDDGRLSRRHVVLARRADGWVVEDLQSRNGTWVDGVRLAGRTSAPVRPRVVRFGGTLAIPVADVAPHTAGVSTASGLVVGGVLRAALDAIAAFGRSEKTLHLVGETGAGKEVGARAFHAAVSGKDRPFVALNCAAVPPAIAERLLFGTRRGAYSGAHEDAEGYLQAANGGTLFLDEIAELELPLQAKLLRVLETGEVLRLGATRPERVELRLCTATNVDLRERVAAGTFRGDLYYRLGRPSVALPPLRERLEEIPFLIDLVLGGVDPRLKASLAFVEECLLRPWPGNVRELLVEVRCAAQLALAQSAHELLPAMLAPTAGRALGTAPKEQPAPPPSPVTRGADSCTPEEIDRALEASGGNVSEAARRLGVHRTTLRRLLAQRRVRS